jgi:hypothetical protein
MYSMMASSVRQLLAVAVLSFSFIVAQAQSATNQFNKKETKPYKILTSGKQITIKSSRKIQHVMLWTNNGHRVVEQREINADTYYFIIPINDKIFFLMIGLEGGKIYTEKIGIQ